MLLKSVICFDDVVMYIETESAIVFKHSTFFKKYRIAFIHFIILERKNQVYLREWRLKLRE